MLAVSESQFTDFYCLLVSFVLFFSTVFCSGAALSLLLYEELDLVLAVLLVERELDLFFLEDSLSDPDFAWSF